MNKHAGTLRNESRAWVEVPADDNGDAMIAAMAEAGVDYIFFTSGSEIGFYQEAVAKAHAQGRKAPKLITVTHEHAEPQRGARLCRGERQARGHRGACRLRHAALRRRGAHRVPLRPAGGHHRRRLADQLSRQLPRRARRRRPHLAAAELRPERHRAAVHQVGSPHGDPGQRRADDLARPAGGAHRAVRAGVSARCRAKCRCTRSTARSFRPWTSSAWRKPAAPDAEGIREIARRLVKADNPFVLVARSGRNPATVPALVRLCELMALPVAQSGLRAYQCFPLNHPLYMSGASLKDADVVLALDVDIPWLADSNPPPDSAWVAMTDVEPAKRRIPTMEFTADLRLTADALSVIEALEAEARALITPEDQPRFAARAAEMRGGLRQAPHRSGRGRQVARQQDADRSEVAVAQHRQGARRQLHRVRRDHRAEPVARLPQHRAARRLLPQSGLERRLGAAARRSAPSSRRPTRT